VYCCVCRKSYDGGVKNVIQSTPRRTDATRWTTAMGVETHGLITKLRTVGVQLGWSTLTDEELKLQNFDRNDWKQYKLYYYRHKETGRQIHEETYRAKCDQKLVWSEAVEHVADELQELVHRWMSSQKPEYEVVARELQSKLEELQ